MEKTLTKNKSMKAIKGFFETYFCLAAIIVLCVILTVVSPYFFNYDNF